MRIISWNINGLKAIIGKGFLEFIKETNADIYLFQEVKSDIVPIDLQFSDYSIYLNPAKKRGYSGTMTLTKIKPISVKYGLGEEQYDSEGRVITAEFEDFYVINVYFPNAGEGLKRLDFKLSFNKAFENYVLSLNKPIIACGDFNVAHEEIDIARPKENIEHAGFTPQEREWFSHFLSLGFIDTFRMFIKEGGHYSWWSYRFHAREKNIGWRIDYCIVSKSLNKKVRKSDILGSIIGSDHAPIILEIDL
ncbi:exodeoxyribonuclease III [Candidatus Acidianus copahuensis]|uniref:Exodeoxyribonuclease III n=1 Tax=Candidatus Acidianus copahuensis TaxID=1160895 RepID=A0A031LRX2_9CREN|nr:exodeoxyribonuclease III [Candidatus Acidianus copahuensis]EZQ11097.1 exodeoxyribonuclease III [Candidatus Acidianus copahuensis]